MPVYEKLRVTKITYDPSYYKRWYRRRVLRNVSFHLDVRYPARVSSTAYKGLTEYVDEDDIPALKAIWRAWSDIRVLEVVHRSGRLPLPVLKQEKVDDGRFAKTWELEEVEIR